MLSFWEKRAVQKAPGEIRPWLKRAIRAATPLIKIAHRPRVIGAEHLPDTPCLYVANHSGAIALSEIFCLASWAVARDTSAPKIAAMTHPVGLALWPAHILMRAFGAVPSVKQDGIEVLQAGTSVLCFPGGGHETMRPVWQWEKVDFGGHKGFLDIAKRANVPIVPVGIRGSHLTAPILWRGGKWLRYPLFLYPLVGVKQVPITLLGVVGVAAISVAPIPMLAKCGLCVLWLNSPWPLLPIFPAPITIRMGAPIPPDALFQNGRDEAYKMVTSALQDLVATPRDARQPG